MTDKGIIFSAPMVRALLDGRKTQTRRVLKEGGLWEWDGKEMRPIPVGFSPGDRLYVREGFNQFWFSQDGDEAWPAKKLVGPAEKREIADEGSRVAPPQIVYRESDRAREWFSDQTWRASSHMPRWASRLTLIVTDVRVQRLQEISARDACQEGVESGQPYVAGPTYYVDNFRDLWNSLHGHDAWAANLWVAAYSFTVHRQNIDQMERAA